MAAFNFGRNFFVKHATATIRTIVKGRNWAVVGGPFFFILSPFLPAVSFSEQGLQNVFSISHISIMM